MLIMDTRKKFGLTRAELALKTGFSCENIISTIEGRNTDSIKSVTFESLLPILIILKINLSDLYVNSKKIASNQQEAEHTKIYIQNVVNQYSNSIGSMVRESRNKLCMSGEELGAIGGVTKQTISNLERSISTNLRISVLLPILSALEIDISTFLEINDDLDKMKKYPRLIEGKTNSKNSFETLFNFILFNRVEILEKDLSIKVSELELEKYNNRMRFDLFGVQHSKQIPVIIESQMGEMDKDHLQKVTKRITSMKECIVIWISSKTRIEYVEQLKQIISESKNITKLFIVEFKRDYCHLLHDLQKDTPKEAYLHIRSTEFPLPKLTLIDTISSIPKHYIGSWEKELPAHNLAAYQKNIDFLEQLRKHYPYRMNVMNSKSKLNQNGISFGSGISGIEIKTVLSQTYKSGSVLIVRSTDKRGLLALKALKLSLYSIPFTAKISEGKNSFKIHYEEHTPISSAIRMVLDFGRILQIIDKFK